jgi:D-alanine-D-alanine ligase
MDMLNIPYTGPGCDSLVVVKDKSLVRGGAMSVGVPVPVEVFIDVTDDIESTIPDDMVYPAFCKLANSSGSVGVISEGLSHNKEEAIRGLNKLREEHPTRPLLLQEFLSGREFSIGMVGNPELGDFEVFHPVEVDYARLDPKYPAVQLEEFKRDGESEFWQQVKEVKAVLTTKQLKDIKEYARRMFIRTRCKDFARMDFRMDSKGQLKLMDVNPNCWLGGKYQMMAEWQGYSWSEILSKIVHTAQKRYALQRQKEEAQKQRALAKEKLELEKAQQQGVFVHERAVCS